MQDVWIEICNQLRLSKAEKSAVQRFEKDRRSFLPVADILRNHRKENECIEMLYEGVNTYPNFSVARVVLARDLFQRKLFVEANALLENSPNQLNDNILAQKLYFKLALIFGREATLQKISRRLEYNNLHDAETKSLSAELSQGDFTNVRTRYTRSLGLEVPPTLTSAIKEEEESRFSFSPEEQTIEPIHQFEVMPVKNILKGASKGKTKSGIELDTTTLGELYFRQGFYQRAAQVYERLIRMNPKNDTLQARYSEAKRKAKEQKEEQIGLSPDLVDQMETMELLDIQRDFFQGLLEKIES